MKKVESTQYLAIYGTLKRNSKEPFVKKLKSSLEYVSSCTIKGKLYDLGRIPALKLGAGSVQAELYKVIEPNILNKIDKYEAVDNIDPQSPGFKRVKTKLTQPNIEAWVYEYQGKPDKSQYIASGKWLPAKNSSVVLAIRTDSPNAELYLLKYNETPIAKFSWQADRNLAMQLLPAIQNILRDNSLTTENLNGVIIFTGSGSFTGLRIGTTVGNTLAYSQNIPVVSAAGKHWLKLGMKKIQKAKPGKYVTPKYSSLPNITKPKA